MSDAGETAEMNLTRPEACGLFESLLAAGTAVRVKVTGRSMAPFLRGGEVLTIRPVGAAALRVGDVVFFRKNGLPDPAIHRVIRIRRGPGGTVRVQTQGDALNAPDEPVDPRDVLGKVCLVEKTNMPSGSAPVNLESWAWRAACRLRAWTSRAKFLVLRAYSKCLPWLSSRWRAARQRDLPVTGWAQREIPASAGKPRPAAASGLGMTG